MILSNYSLLPHNTFGFDVACDTFFEYTSVDELKDFISQGRLSGKKYLHIGGGSNLVFVNDFHGIVLHSQIKGFEILERTNTSVRVRVGAGEVWDDFVSWSLTQALYGLENLSHIPGEVGAAAVQNIGAYGKEASQYIEQIEAIDLHTGKVVCFHVSECDYAYRHSIFKSTLKNQYAITHVHFVLSTIFTPDLNYGAITSALEEQHIATPTALQLRECIINVRDSKLPDPKHVGNAGSFFMNPVISEKHFSLLQQTYPNVPHYHVGDGIKVPAGWLIEQCGWKGKSIDNVGVYHKQALVLVNHGGAKGTDIVNLAQTIVNDVKEKFGIELIAEANYIF